MAVNSLTPGIASYGSGFEISGFDDEFFANEKVNGISNALDFGKMLGDKLTELSEVKNQSDLEKTQYLNGERDDIQNILIDSEKADLSLSLALQVRNRLVDGFQEIMRMQI